MIDRQKKVETVEMDHLEDQEMIVRNETKRKNGDRRNHNTGCREETLDMIQACKYNKKDSQEWQWNGNRKKKERGRYKITWVLGVRRALSDLEEGQPRDWTVTQDAINRIIVNLINIWQIGTLVLF